MADYHSLLMRAVANLPNAGTPATRAAIYGRARKALLEQLRSLRPPLPESDITREEKALDAAIAEIEGRYGSQDPAPPPASAPPTPTSPAAGKPGAAPAKAVPAAPAIRPLSSAPAAPAAPGPSEASARSPSQTGAPSQPGAASAPVQGAAQRPPPPTQARSQPAGSPPQAPTPPAGKPAAAAPTVASPARSQLAAAMANPPSSARTGRAAPPVGAKGGKDEGLPGVAALDPGRAVRPNKADDAQASGAPPVIATRHDESGAIGRGAGSSGRVRPPRPGVQTGGGDPAPGRAGRRCRQAETLALDRSGGRPWNCPCGGGSRDPDASEAAGPRHQAPSRSAATRPAGALGEDRGASPSKPASPGCASTSRERTASGPTERSRRAAPPTVGARSAECATPRRRRRPAGRRCWSLRRTIRRSRS